MWLSEEISESHPLFNKIQYITQQSCEKHDTEVNYKNINRKYIGFDLCDKMLMMLVGMTLKPFGFLQNLQDYLIDSKIRFFRVWAETSIAKRGISHLRSLYLQHPEKFFGIEFENARKTNMKLLKGNYVINEICNTKRVSLHETEQFSGMMNDFKNQMHKEDMSLALENHPREESSPSKLLSINEHRATY